MRKFLKFALLLLISTVILLSLAAWGFLSRYIEIEGFHLSTKTLKVELVKVNYGGLKAAVSNLECSFENKTCGVSSIAVSLPPSPPEAPSLPLRLRLKPYLNRFSEILKGFGWNIRVGTVFYYQNPISVNLYDLSIGRGKIKLDHFEIFGNETLYAEGGAVLKAGNLLKLSGVVKTPALTFNGTLRYFEGGFANLEGNLYGEKGYLGGLNLTASLGKVIKGDFNGKIEKAAFGGKFKFDGYKFTAKGWLDAYGFKGHYGVYYPLYGEVRAWLFGDYKVCGKGLTISAEYFHNLLSLAYTDGVDLYGGIFLNGSKLKGYLSGEEGFAKLEGNLAKLLFKICFKNFSISACGLKVSTLYGKAVYSKRNLKGDLSAKEIAYGDLVKVGKQAVRFSYSLKNRIGSALLNGSVEGKLRFQETEVEAGPLKVSAEVNGKDFLLDLPEGRLKLSKNLSFSGEIKKLSYDDYGAANFKLFATYGEKKLVATFEGAIDGNAELDLRGNYDYLANLRGVLLFGNRTLSVKLKGSGNLGSGKVSLNLNDTYYADLNYAKKGDKYKGRATLGLKKLFETYGVFSFRGATAAGNFTLLFKPKGQNLFVKADYGWRLDVKRKTFGASFKPFTVNYGAIKLARIRDLEIVFKRQELKAELKADPSYPVYGYTNLSLNTASKRLVLDGNLFLRPDFLNVYLAPYGTYIPAEKPFKFLLSYDGSPDKFLEGLLISSASEFDLWTVYAYKPLKVFLSLYNGGGNYTLFVGLRDGATGEVLGNAQGVFNAVKKTVEGNWNINDFPLRVVYENSLHAYLDLSTDGDLKFLPGKSVSIKTSVLLGGYLRVDSYKFLNSAEGGSSNSKLKINYNLSVNTPTPIYVKTPNGNFIITLKGKLSDKNGTFEVFINYGRLNLFGKTFYVSNGVVKREGSKTYVDIPMILYTPVRTIYLKVYGYLPWNKLKLNIYSVPSAPKQELLAYLLSGGAGVGGSSMPLSQVFLKAASFGVAHLMDRIASEFIGGVEISFVPTFDPTQGLVMGVQIEKYLGDYAKIGYYHSFSPNPKATYMWASLKFVDNSFLRFTRYADGTLSASMRFSETFGSPYW